MTLPDQETQSVVRASVDAELSEVPSADDLWARTQRRIRGRRRTRVVVRSGIGGLVSLALLGVLWLPVLRTERPAVVVFDNTAPMSSTKLGFLDGTRIRLTLPEGLVASGNAAEMSAAVYAATSLEDVTGSTPGWRLDVVAGSIDDVTGDGRAVPVPDTSAATGARLDAAATVLGLQFGRFAVIVSGGSLEATDVDLLLAGLAFRGATDGSLVYDGSLPLWVVESPNVRTETPAGVISVFFRECSKPGGERTPTGLEVTRVDDVERGSNLAVLCDRKTRLEIWIDTPAPVPDDVLARVDAEVTRLGSLLRALQAGTGVGSSSP